MKLEPLTLEQCQIVRTWRNNEMEVWRTPFMLTESMQAEFYYERVSNRHSDHRYWAIISTSVAPDFTEKFIGMGGITYIQWENRIGEITLIIDPEKRKDGLGEKAVILLLNQAFNHLNLQTVIGECYFCNSAWEFWQKLTNKYIVGSVDRERASGWEIVPNRKYFNGKYWKSLEFFIDKDDFNAKHNSK